MSIPTAALDRRHYDIAAADLEHAAGLPGSEGLDAARCLRWVDDATSRVRSQTEQHLSQFKENPARYDHSEAVFRMMWLVTVLQRDLGVHYHHEVVEKDDHKFFADSANLFIHGIIQGKGGTCSSMPVLFAAIGRRLGYPLKLVPGTQHEFVRWEGPEGERFNVECTSRGFVSQPDAYYLTWPVAAPPDKVKRYKLLQAKTQEEEIAGFICNRGHIRLAYGWYRDATFEYLRAFHQAPGREGIVICLHRSVTAWGKHLRAQISWAFPGLYICNGPCRHRALPEDLQAEMNYLNALELLLNNPEKKRLWWDPLRRNPTRRPLGMPEWIQITYPATPGDPLRFEPCQPPRDESRLSPFE